MKTISTLIGRHDILKMAKQYRDHEDEINKITYFETEVFRQLINAQYSEISKHLSIEFVNGEPYGTKPSLDAMLPDFRKGKMYIHATGNDSALWGPFANLQFRAIHDFIHLTHELDFTHKDEVKVYPLQFQFSIQPKFVERFPHLNWDKYNRVLRSEVVYQSAYKECFEAFHIDQKIILADL